MDKKQIAADLRLESNRLQEEAKQLLQAADVLDPLPRQTTFRDNATELKVNDDDRKETIVDIAVTVLEKAGIALRKEQLFEQVQARGGQVANFESFASALSRAKGKVVPIGNGFWDLGERIPGNGSTVHPSGEVPEISAETIRQFLRTKNARIPELARHFRTTERSIYEIVSDPANRITVHGPGWLRLDEGT